MNLFGLFIIVSFYLFALPGKTYAYLDPGTGSYLLQLTIGIVLGGIFSLKVFWKQIKNLLSTKSRFYKVILKRYAKKIK